MGELGDLFELLHGARDSFETVRAGVRDWRHVERSDRAWRRFAGTPPEQEFVDALRSEVLREAEESTGRLWFEKPARVRYEHDGRDGTSVSVRDGQHVWRYSSAFGALASARPPEEDLGVAGLVLEHLFDPAPLIGDLDFEFLGRTSVAGRSALRLRARPRFRGFWDDGGRDVWRRFLLPPGADEYELLVDAERGVILRSAARLDDEDFRVTELTEVAFDEELPPETFTFDLPPGEEFLPPREEVLRSNVTIEEAVSLVPFTIFIPSRMSEGWRMRVLVYPGEARPAMPPMVIIEYSRPDATHGVAIVEIGADAPDIDEVFGLEPLERGGRDLQVDAESQDLEGTTVARVHLVVDGTRVMMKSPDLGLDGLLELADALVPAPTEPPRLSD